MTDITKVEKFLAVVNKKLKEKLPMLHLPKIEEIRLKMAIYHIFEKHHDPEELYHELIDFLEDEGLSSWVNDMEDCYDSINK